MNYHWVSGSILEEANLGVLFGVTTGWTMVVTSFERWVKHPSQNKKRSFFYSSQEMVWHVIRCKTTKCCYFILWFLYRLNKWDTALFWEVSFRDNAEFFFFFLSAVDTASWPFLSVSNHCSQLNYQLSSYNFLTRKQISKMSNHSLSRHEQIQLDLSVSVVRSS